jgi:hypothetical protein
VKAFLSYGPRLVTLLSEALGRVESSSTWHLEAPEYLACRDAAMDLEGA